MTFIQKYIIASMAFGISIPVITILTDGWSSPMTKDLALGLMIAIIMVAGLGVALIASYQEYNDDSDYCPRCGK